MSKKNNLNIQLLERMAGFVPIHILLTLPRVVKPITDTTLLLESKEK